MVTAASPVVTLPGRCKTLPIMPAVPAIRVIWEPDTDRICTIPVAVNASKSSGLMP